MEKEMEKVKNIIGMYLYNRKYNGKGYDENGNIIYEVKDGKSLIKEYTVYLKNLVY